MNFCFLDTAYSFAHIILCSTPSLSQGSFWGLLKTSLNKILNFPPPPLLSPPPPCYYISLETGNSNHWKNWWRGITEGYYYIHISLAEHCSQ